MATGGNYLEGGADVAVADGGTGASDAATALTNLGAEGIANKGAGNGYMGLDAGGLADPSNLPAATPSAQGAVALSNDEEASASEAVQGNDSRLPERTTITTSDGLGQTRVVWSKALADNTVYSLRAEVLGRRTDAAARGRYVRELCVYREAAGAATIQGSEMVPVNDQESDAAWTAAFVVNANSIELRVTGAAGKTVNWKASVMVVAVS